MADGKLDLPDDLLSSKTLDQHRYVKDEVWGGTGGDKLVMGLLDGSKDQITSDSSVPLSPQWLYAKPVDAKISIAGVSGEMHASNPLSHGNTTDTNLKDSWHLDGSQDKKDWRKIVPDVKCSRRWCEEERETSLLGRRDRRKEDRGADVDSSRDVSENRALSSTDHWHDPSNRNSMHESQRDSKWSSRWGPEDKEKDSRTEKRTDAEKEDTHIDRQSFVSGNRRASERDNDSHDKWRPRYRMEVHAGVSAAYRSAAGFGPERGRVEGSNIPFSAGRGRSTINGSLQVGRSPSLSVVGSAAVDKLFGSSASSTHCYPRGKLLDIFRKQKTLPSYDAIPDDMDHVSPITQVEAIEPLAFFAPAAEEEAVLGDILKGKIRSSGVLQNSFGDEIVASNDYNSGFVNTTFDEGKLSYSVVTEETIETFEGAAVNSSGEGNSSDGLDTSDHQTVVAKEKHGFKEGMGKIMTGTTDVVTHDVVFERQENKCLESQKGEDMILSKPKLEDIKLDTVDIGGHLPDDSNSLLNFSSFQQTSNCDQLHLRSSDERRPSDIVAPPEDLSLFYLDPQGVIQGPYMGIDIITWFDQGYFGTDLPVCLSDAPAGSPFQELGEVMPHLKVKFGSSPGTTMVNTSQLSDAVGDDLVESLSPPASGPDFKGSALTDQQWVSSGPEATSSVNFPSRVLNHDNRSELQFSDNRSFHNFVAQDEVTEMVFSGRPGSSSRNSLRVSAADIYSSISSRASHHSLANEYSENSVPGHQEDDKLHPFGLLMSELRDSSHLRRTQSSNGASTIGDQGRFMDSLLERDTSFVNQSAFNTMADQSSLGETWSEDGRRNILSKSYIHQGSIDSDHLFCKEQKLNDFDMGEYLISQKLQNGQLQHQSHLCHATGMEIERIPGFAHSQSKNLNLQQAGHPRADMEQLLEHLEHQQQHHLELQRQRHLELQEQQRRLELQQQHRLLQLQQQQQQQIRLNQIKLLQQQQRQLFMERLLQHQMSNPGYGHLKVDPMRENVLDQVQLRMHRLHELQQNFHTRQLDPSVEQIILAKIGQSTLRGQPDASLDLILQAKHANMLSSEQQIRFQQEPLQAWPLSMGLSQHLGMERERYGNGPWSVDEDGQFSRSISSHHQAQYAGFNASDFHQQQCRIPSHEEQFNHLKWNRAIWEQHQQGFYEPSSMALDRSMSLSPAVAPGMDLDNINVRAQGLDFPDQHPYGHSTGQLGSFCSGIPSNSQPVSEELDAYPDLIERPLSRDNELVGNSWIERKIQQLNLKDEQQRRESEISTAPLDSSIWAPIGGDEENSKQAMMDFLHQDLGHQSMQSSEVDYQHHISSSKTQEIVWPGPETYSSYLPFNHLSDQEVGERFIQAGSTAAIEHSNSVIKSAMDKDFSELPGLEGKIHESKVTSRSVSEIKDNLVKQAEKSLDSGELPINAHGRPTSLSVAGGNGGLYSSQIRLDKSLVEASNDRLPSILTQGLDTDWNKRPPVSQASSFLEVLPEPTSAPFVKQRSSASLTSDEGNRESVVNPLATCAPATQPSGKKELHFRRTSSCGDAAVSETSFRDMLKKPVVPAADASTFESCDGSAPTGQSGKKKGKKGRQIDPALLGFKVSSNRILMGEIQRLED